MFVVAHVGKDDSGGARRWEAVGVLVLVQIVENLMVMMLCDLAGAIRWQEVIREHADPAAVVIHC